MSFEDSPSSDLTSPLLNLDNFSGIVPVLPLPSAVLFPHLSIPLQVYEEPFQQLISDVLRGDRLLAIALLKENWDVPGGSSLEIHEMVCLARIVAEERLPSGRFNLVVHGIYRAAIVEELTSQRPYRLIQVELYRDFYPLEPACGRKIRQRELLNCARRLSPHSAIDPLFAQLLETDMPFGALCDLLANVLPLNPVHKQEVLDELDVDVRSEILLGHLQELFTEQCLEAPRSPFSVQFSMN